MRVLLTIGHIHFLLPDDKGVATIMKALSNAIEVGDRTYLMEDPHLIFEGEANVEMKLVPRGMKVLGLPRAERKVKVLALPEPTSILL